MGRKKSKAVSLLNRIQFVDLAQAVAISPHARRSWLRGYLARALRGGRFSSYKPFRDALPTIYGVTRGLDPSPPVDRPALETHIRKACLPDDEEKNVEVALILFDIVRPRGYAAYDHPKRNIQLGLGRVAAIGLSYELVHGDELIFQFAYPRRDRLDDYAIRVLLSLIHHAYAVGDREGAAIEIVDMSCDLETAEAKRARLPRVRSPRLLRLAPSDILSLDELAPEVQNVHDLLLELGDEPEAES